MNEAKLKKLLEIFEESGIEELEYQHSFWRGTRIRLSRSRGQAPMVYAPAPVPAPQVATPGPTPVPTADAPAPAKTGDDDLHVVTSPMVGTYYRSSSPESEPFVREGERVRKGETLCIIEAMKIMNEIPSDIDGEVVEILVENAEPVEYNQPLVKIRPV